MSHHGGVVDALRTAVHAVKKSPSVIRKKLGNHKLEYSELEDSETHWLHADDKIQHGLTYDVKYIGSAEIDYIAGNPAENNKLAMRTVEFIKEETTLEDRMPGTLSVTTGTIELRDSNGAIIMRHSTSRIAYSTVHTDLPRYFCYVGLPKKNPTPVCHVFYTKSAKLSYELTFTFAQAFDANYKIWLKDKTAASHLDAKDVEPKNTMRSPLCQRKPLRASNEGRTSSPLTVGQSADSIGKISLADQQGSHEKGKGSSHLHAPASTTAPTVSAADADAKEPESPTAFAPLRTQGGWQPGDRLADSGEPAEGTPRRRVTIPSFMLEVEDDEQINTDLENFFLALTAAKSKPNLLEIGVAPEDFHRASENSSPFPGATGAH